MVELPEEKRLVAEVAVQQLLQSWHSQQELYLSQLHQLLESHLATLEEKHQKKFVRVLESIRQVPVGLLEGLQSLHVAGHPPDDTTDSPPPTDLDPIV